MFQCEIFLWNSFFLFFSIGIEMCFMCVKIFVREKSSKKKLCGCLCVNVILQLRRWRWMNKVFQPRIFLFIFFTLICLSVSECVNVSSVQMDFGNKFPEMCFYVCVTHVCVCARKIVEKNLHACLCVHVVLLLRHW